MIALLVTLVAVGVAAIAVTWYAVVSAQDGYEDETGFHPAPGKQSRVVPPPVGDVPAPGAGDGDGPEPSVRTYITVR